MYRSMNVSAINRYEQQNFPIPQKIAPGTILRAIRQTTTSSAAGAPQISAQAQKIVGGWLLTCAGMCVGAVVLGGITRYAGCPVVESLMLSVK